MDFNIYDRNIRFFGEEGQQRLQETHVAVVGVGGLGTHVVQQLAHLGVGELSLVDDEELDDTNLNRYIGSRHDDPIPGSTKVDLARRQVSTINPGIQVNAHEASVPSREAFAVLPSADWIFGCVDNEGARLILTELTSAYSLPYVDLASDIIESDEYGGRVFVSRDGTGCLQCLDQLDQAEVQDDLASTEERHDRDAIYGVQPEHLGNAGPSVVSINGVVASLGVTEFMVQATGIREANRLVFYRGHRPIVTVSNDKPEPNCYYCKGIYGKGDEVDLERYLD